jgi:uncharacterized protein
MTVKLCHPGFRAARSVPVVSVPNENRYAALRRLGDLGRAVERQRGPDPYPRPTGPPPSLEELRQRGDQINRVVESHGARKLRVFGSVARGEAESGSDLDLLVDMGDGASLLKLAALQGALEDLLGCPVHLTATTGLKHATEDVRQRIEAEAILL